MISYAPKKQDQAGPSVANTYSRRGPHLEERNGLPPDPLKALQARVNLRPQVRHVTQLQQMLNSEEEELLQGKFEPIQRLRSEEEELGKFETVQRQDPEQVELLQGKLGVAQRKEEPAHQPNHTGLADNLKSGIESLAGLSLDNVKVHYNSSQPAQLNALAYTQGSDIHVAPGQERYLPHEAWHVVQQAQGRVTPTMQMKGGVPVNDDQGLEHEADVMGANALRLAAQPQSAPVGEEIDTGTYEPVQGEAVEVARLVSGVRVPALPQSEPIVQRVRIRNKGINGLTHLVTLTTDGHLYNEDWLNNEREEVHHGDLLKVDLDNALYSRRGINQEANVERDKEGPQNHLWVEATSLNDHKLPADRFVREEMLIDPVVMIHVPRPREGLDGAIDGMAKLLRALMTEKIVVEPEQCERLLQNVVGVKNKLHISSAPVAIDLETIGVELEKVLFSIEQLKLGGNEQADQKLREAAQLLRFAFGQYKEPKRQVTTGGKIDRAALEQLGVQGIDLGGTGLKGGMLDVNLSDEINDKNFLVLGDAMDLQSTFEPNCVDSVIAELLPLVDMETSHSVEARIQVIERVLAGVNYICPNGSAKIQFNDNSEPGRVDEFQLVELAAQYGFKLEHQAARRIISMAELMSGRKLLESKSSGSKPSARVSQKPPEGLYRWFTFER